MREAFANRRGPMSIHYVVAAGTTPGGTWHTDPAVGGGRTIGEGCHFVDLCCHLIGKPATRVYARALGRNPGTDDSIVAILGFDDGSTATISYLANANPALAKERWEASAEGKTAICENFRVTRILGGKTLKTVNQDKGQATGIREVVDAVRAGRESPISLDEIVAVSRVTFAMNESVRTERAVAVAPGPAAGGGG